MPSESRLSLGLSRLRRRVFSNYEAVRRVLFAGVIIIVVVIGAVFLLPLLRLSKEALFGPINIFSLFVPRGAEIKQTDGRTNFLILGVGDAGHDGPDLTDSMMVVSVKSKFAEKEDPAASPVILISVPRDIYLDSLNSKINTAYALGSVRGPQAAMALSEGVVSQVTGLPIHYGVKLDFSAFAKIIDLFNGVDVKVERDLDDFEYPIDGKETDNCGMTDRQIESRLATLSAEQSFPCRYEHLHISAGPQHMDGALALKFARSRHAQGDEGTDFARAKRQQLIISALKAKIFSSETFLNPSKVEQIYNLIKSHVATDIDPSVHNEFLKLALKYRSARFKSVVIDTALLDNPPQDERGWILLPKSGNWQQVHDYIKAQLQSQ